MDKKLLGRYIKTYRVKKGLTQAELAEIVNVATGMIGRYERGETAPGRDIIFELARVLEFSLDAIVLRPEIIPQKIFPNDFFEDFNKLTVLEQKVTINAAKAVMDTFLEK